MIVALREIVVPVLRDAKFSGSFPHFRRIRETQIDLLTFQFSRWGGEFAIEIGFCDSRGVMAIWNGKHIPPKKVTAHDIHGVRPRLGSQPPPKMDHWFRFEPDSATIYRDVAQEVLPLLVSQAEVYWTTNKFPTILDAEPVRPANSPQGWWLS